MGTNRAEAVATPTAEEQTSEAEPETETFVRTATGPQESPTTHPHLLASSPTAVPANHARCCHETTTTQRMSASHPYLRTGEGSLRVKVPVGLYHECLPPQKQLSDATYLSSLTSRVGSMIITTAIDLKVGVGQINHQPTYESLFPSYNVG